MMPRGDKSVWDRPSLSSLLSECDQERWLMAAAGSTLAMVGARRGGFSGGIVAMAGGVLAVRAAMGHHDLRVARRWVEQTLTEQGFGPIDTVEDSSEASFPASDSPSWTAVSGATPQK
jgi:uncharacterized membrane protein